MGFTARALPLALLASLAAAQAASDEPRPRSITPVLRPLAPGALQLDGWLGERVEAHREHWLATVDLDARIAPFAHRPALQPWAGEHLGKWMHATALALRYRDDERLRGRLDRAGAALLAAQGTDGYLGAYLPDQRFQLLPGADWDVWTIKYALLGLLAWHEATGDAAALAAARRGADLLLDTFGPGRRDILAAGTHVGMAATSVLEPIARLYHCTGDPRYLAFARYLIASWDHPGGPRIADGLRRHGHVAGVANAKAYEMLSNLLGLCVLHRATGERELLEPVLAAWDDIVARELLPTGSMSAHERFVGGGHLPTGPGASPAETCVTVTWLQLQLELLEQLGEARFGRELERTAYNHLPAAQRPDGGAFCYYTPLFGHKPYDTAITCCTSSGARGIALLPRGAAQLGRDGDRDMLVFPLLAACRGSASLGGRLVEFTLQSGLPFRGDVQLGFAGELPATFGVRLRLSEWALPAQWTIGDETGSCAGDGWLELPARAWAPTDRVTLRLRCRGRVVDDPHDPARTLLCWGPAVLSLDGARVPDVLTSGFALDLAPVEPDRQHPGSFLAMLWHAGVRERLPLRPFADVGAGGEAYRVWLQRGTSTGRFELVGSARSRAGNVEGSIVDGDTDSFVVTYDGEAAERDWYEVALRSPRRVSTIEFAHGHCFHDGGWFDASAGKPQVQVRRTAADDWQTIGALADYPATTATDSAGLRDGQRFRLDLTAPIDAVMVRVVGRPAFGDRSEQAFSSCAELRCQD
ncbi:MAG: glycoside hydrolase family 127 protein [Planctomycetes bacterium]|nr:glycoside hydrolase family 127 protein [Planctomycetota bacterium]